MFKKNDEIVLDIEDLTVQGEGIGRADGMPFFVRGAIPGDRIRAGVTRLKKTYGYARLIEVLAASPDRIAPPCPAASRCGGCQLMPMAYPAQLRQKERQVRRCFERIGGFSADVLDAAQQPILGMEQPLRYRNKGQYPVGRDEDGRIVTGFYAAHSHRIIPAEDCLLQQENNAAILREVRAWMEETGTEPYDEERHEGLLRHVMIRTAQATGQIMVCLVTNGRTIAAESLCRRLAAMDGMTSVVQNINTKRTNVIFGDETKILWGADTITDRLCGNVFAISARSFYQVNPLQTQKLYSLAVEYAQLTGQETVWDLYCGIGTITLAMAKNARKAIGIEIVPEAIADAKQNAAANGLGNTEFFCGAAEELLPKLVAEEVIPRPDVIVVDPPRKGCDSACLETMLAMAPKRIVYVSCDPATLARDARILCDGGYEIRQYRPVDQFGFSMHIETVCLLTHKD